MNYYIETSPGCYGEISQSDYDSVIGGSGTDFKGYTVYDAEAKLIVEDEESITVEAYKKDDAWYRIPKAFKDMEVHYADE